MSLLTYNSVTLPYPITTRFSQDAVYDESNTDRTLTKIDITVQSIITQDYLPIVCPDLPRFVPLGTNAAGIMSVIRSQLLQSRKDLSFTFNGVQLLPQKAGVTGTVDAKNGPIPQSCHVTELNNNTFLITFHIIAHYIENNLIGIHSLTNQDGNAVMTNRWEESVEINNLNMTVRTRAGSFSIRSDNDFGFTADRFRSQMAIVGIPLSDNHPPLLSRRQVAILRARHEGRPSAMVK